MALAILGEMRGRRRNKRSILQNTAPYGEPLPYLNGAEAEITQRSLLKKANEMRQLNVEEEDNTIKSKRNVNTQQNTESKRDAINKKYKKCYLKILDVLYWR